MTELEQNIAILAKKHGVDNCAAIDVDAISFRREFREACATNACGKYGACWVCPPDCGDIDDMIAKAKSYKRAFVYQTIGQLEDSFDIEGMMEAGTRHREIGWALSEEVLPLLENCLPLGAGACGLCDPCTKLTNEPCRYPDKAICSLESYGIAVSDLAAACGMKYINGTNTVTYFGGYLYG